MDIAVVEQAIKANNMFVAFVQCAVQYSGRAETFLERGDRLLVIKADNTVLLHQQESNNPVNYMKPGSTITVEQADDHAILHVQHEKEKAWLDIEIFTLYNSMTEKLADGHAIELAGNERDMSEYIRHNPHRISATFRPVSREEQTDVGFIDVFGHNNNGQIVVVECKRTTASLSAVDQLRRYVERVKQIKGTEQVTGVLAAPAITPNAQKMLTSWHYSFAQVEPPKRLERWRKDQKSLVEF